MPLEVDAAQIKAPAKASTTKGLQERKTANVMVETNRALSSKEKRDAEVAGGMVKLISSRYESTAKDTTEKIPQSSSFANSRPSFNMSWLPSVKRDVFGAVTSHNKSATCSTSHGKDIFAFNIDSQLDCISGKDKTFTNTSAVSSGGINKSGLGTTKKGQPVAKEKRHVKKHLFSDTDTDNGMTEVSWLRESGRKPKPKVTKYPRQAPVKPKAVSPHTSYESPDLPPPSPKPVKGNTKPNKKTAERVEHPKKTVKPAAAPNRRHAAGRRPQRAAAACAKSYKEPDTDYSQSESDEPPVSKYSSTDHLENAEKMGEAAQVTKKSTSSKRLTKSYMTNLHSSHSASVPEQPTTSKLFEHLCLFWALTAAERSAPTLGLTFFPLLTPRGSPLPTSPDPACQDSPSPILLLPKPQPTVSSKGNFKPSSLYSVEKKHSSSKTLSIQSVNSTPSLTPIRQTSIGPSVVETSLTQQSSPPRSPLALSTLPLMTSTLLELEKPPIPSPPQSPLLEDTTHNYGCNFDFSKVSSVSLPSTKSSVFSCRVKDTPAEVLDVEAEKSPPSDRRRKPLQLHVSGPTHKRRISSSSDSEEDEKEEKKKSKMRGQRSPRMKPRKLFKSCTGRLKLMNGDLDIDEDLELPKSAANPSNLCQQFSSELKKKFQKRYQMMEVYNKHSLKTVQQHVSSLNVEVTRYRTQRLEQVQGVLLEEIHKLEQDDTVLKNMEKDLTMYWKKQITAFHSYQDRENIRNGTLTKALQNNVCHSVEYEEKIFTNQV
ncbi:Synaptonemal complex protein 2 [Collichthys lucidus]|uniref:Synaptonemal complex protein 2 n=1 Tax=Collichthys lucidus TaxID=240159 RepID=A0A4U5USE6_COLLU|nr:Synaptonemal complex protein 2 [Collichthys lucidus]